MISLKLIDRLAIASMFTVAVAVSAAALTPLAAHAEPARASKAAFQMLNEDAFSQVQRGMRSDEVLALIGPPYRKMRFEATKTTAWDYHYRDPWSYDSDFSVIFDDAGIVVSKVSVRNGQ